ncbi:spore germination protein GerPE [Mesobacillus thioparans]|uniref:spore germination protein GerPE n=1 Tax=Mesobacillus thioparans TaxID=370439 RepID=UPI0039EF5684
MMIKRIASVDHIKIDSVILSSVFQIGDSQQITGISKALAVQREAEIFFDEEGEYTSYPIFFEPIAFQPEVETLMSSTQNINPILKVRNIDIIGVSSSSVVHLGNTCNVTMESRVKHIRQLLPRPERND